MTAIKAASTDRRRQLAAIHAMAKELALTDDCYRARVSTASAGRTQSAGDLTDAERAALIKALRGLGAGKKAPYRQTPQMAMIRGLWIELAELGAVRDRSERALASFVRRQTRIELGRLDPRAAEQVIEALKSWRDRVTDAAGDGAEAGDAG